MAEWLVRAGSHGEHESRFFSDNRIYLTWDQARDLRELTDRKAIRAAIAEQHPSYPPGKLANHTGQIFGFISTMRPGDLVVVPRRARAAIAVGRIKSDCRYDAKEEVIYRHHREVEWINLEVPRTRFDKDLLASFAAMMTICQISKPDTEKRTLRAAQGIVGVADATPAPSDESASADEESPDLERVGRDLIASMVIQKFKGHDMARLVDAILKAQGFVTFVSPPGPDKGVDILAAPAPLGFGHPRICVQVKSQDSPGRLPTLQQLTARCRTSARNKGCSSLGAVQSSVDRTAAQLFRVRLWDQDDPIEQLLTHRRRRCRSPCRTAAEAGLDGGE